MTVKETLSWGSQKLKGTKIDSTCLEVEILLIYLLKKPKEWLYTNQGYMLSKKEIQDYKNLIARRLKKEPIAYIINKKEFYGLEFYVDENVLIPRPETELLVEEALQEIPNYKPVSPSQGGSQMTNKSQNSKSKINIIDIGTGSGCIIISLTKQLQHSEQLQHYNFYAIDNSQEALKIAHKNAKKHKVSSKIKFLKDNLLNPLKTQTIDSDYPLLIVANLPYIKASDIKKLPLSIREYEPITALDGGKDGLKYYKELFNQIKKYNFKEVVVFLEIDPRQRRNLTNLIKKYFSSAKFDFIKDYSDKWRILKIYLNA